MEGGGGGRRRQTNRQVIEIIEIMEAEAEAEAGGRRQEAEADRTQNSGLRTQLFQRIFLRVHPLIS